MLTASAIAESVTNLADLLHREVTAQGIETDRQREEVLSIGRPRAELPRRPAGEVRRAVRPAQPHHDVIGLTLR